MLRTYCIIVAGKVQGVFFRQGTKEKANALGIHGTVSNEPDETVLIIATGLPEQLDELVKWCHKGPPRAKVTHVTVSELPLLAFTGFTIER
jgi:acylphosphatase